MADYICKKCGYIYSEEFGCEEVFEAEVENEIVEGYIRDQGDKCDKMGVQPGTRFADLPDDFVCPECGAPKEEFEPR